MVPETGNLVKRRPNPIPCHVLLPVASCSDCAGASRLLQDRVFPGGTSPALLYRGVEPGIPSSRPGADPPGIRYAGRMAGPGARTPNPDHGQCGAGTATRQDSPGSPPFPASDAGRLYGPERQPGNPSRVLSHREPLPAPGNRSSLSGHSRSSRPLEERAVGAQRAVVGPGARHQSGPPRRRGVHLFHDRLRGEQGPHPSSFRRAPLPALGFRPTGPSALEQPPGLGLSHLHDRRGPRPDRHDRGLGRRHPDFPADGRGSQNRGGGAGEHDLGPLPGGMHLRERSPLAPGSRQYGDRSHDGSTTVDAGLDQRRLDLQDSGRGVSRHPLRLPPLRRGGTGRQCPFRLPAQLQPGQPGGGLWMVREMAVG